MKNKEVSKNWVIFLVSALLAALFFYLDSDFVPRFVPGFFALISFLSLILSIIYKPTQNNSSKIVAANEFVSYAFKIAIIAILIIIIFIFIVFPNI